MDYRMLKENFLIFIDFSRKLYNTRHMLKTMAMRDLRTRYVGSAFGLFWAVINPLSQVVIYGVVFGYLLGSKPDKIYGTKSYLVFLFCSLVPWQFFTQAVTASMNSVSANGNLVKKAVGFPSELFPVVTVITNLITHFIGIGLLLFLVILFNGGLYPQALLIFVYTFLVAVFAVGLGWILSSLSVFLKDVKQVVALILMAWMYGTAIFYTPHIGGDKVLYLFELNPMFYVVDGYRLALLAGVTPPLWGFVYMGIVAFGTLAVGGMIFRKLKPVFIEVL